MLLGISLISQKLGIHLQIQKCEGKVENPKKQIENRSKRGKDGWGREGSTYPFGGSIFGLLHLLDAIPVGLVGLIVGGVVLRLRHSCSCGVCRESRHRNRAHKP